MTNLQLLVDQTHGPCQKIFFKARALVSKRTVAKSKQIENQEDGFSFES